MKNVPKPLHKAKVVFCNCVNVRRDKELKARLEKVSQLIEDAETLYEQHGLAKTLFLITPEKVVGVDVTISDMEGLYTEVFARKSSKIRPVYDEIKLAPKDGICPLCAQRPVSTLDHYLPKAKNPSLAVMPLNLVPACFECNHIKDDYHPGVADDQLFHPYFDELNSDIWLFVTIGKTSPPSVSYDVRPPASWDRCLSRRLQFHFSTFALDRLYASQAGATLSGIAGKLESAWQRGGADEVKFVLQEDAMSWGRYSKNSWQAALFRGLVESEWFCTEGFSSIS